MTATTKKPTAIFTTWRCERCKTEGVVSHDPEAGLEIGWLIRRQHSNVNSSRPPEHACKFDPTKISIGATNV